MNIRKAEIRDIPGMIELLKQVGQVHHEIRPDIFRAGAQKYDEAALAEILADPKRPIFVAVVDGAVAGYCFCMVKCFDNAAVSAPHTEIYIDDLCVDENCRGQGIATALYRHTTDYARQLGCGFVTLNVWCGNEGAMEFYNKMGLTPRSITMETKL